MSKQIYLLGAAGLIPFISIPALLAAGWVGEDWAQYAFASYSALILSFLGGIHWYRAVIFTPRLTQAYFAMLPSIIGWFALLMVGFGTTVALLSLAFGLMVLADRWLGPLPAGYRLLRTALTSVVLLCHFFMLLLW